MAHCRHWVLSRLTLLHHLIYIQVVLVLLIWRLPIPLSEWRGLIHCWFEPHMGWFIYLFIYYTSIAVFLIYSNIIRWRPYSIHESSSASVHYINPQAALIPPQKHIPMTCENDKPASSFLWLKHHQTKAFSIEKLWI